jgi:type I restriction enzyme M protein
VLDPSVRKAVDQLWDLVWSAGVTNPLAVVDYLTGLFALSRSGAAATNDAPLALVAEAAAAGDAPRCVGLMGGAMESLGLSIPDEALWRDTALLSRAVACARLITPGERNRDLLGDCFEHVLRRLSTAGHFGQFRTPRHVVRFLVSAVDPRPGEAVLDPACGTAGFLIAAHEHRRGRAGTYLGDECDWTMARIAAANMILHGVQGADIRRRDALTDTAAEADVILANPPFAGSVDAARRRAFASGSARSEVLFLELMMQRLKPRGRAAVVVPAGLLTSPARGAVYVRRKLVREHGLRAVIELPAGVFRPYTDVRSAVLLWRRGGRAGDVLMARVRSDGYTLDDRREPTGASDLDALLPHLRDGADRAALPPLLGRRVRRAELGDACALGPGRYVADALPPARAERTMAAVLADAAGSAGRLEALLAAIAERAR